MQDTGVTKAPPCWTYINRHKTDKIMRTLFIIPLVLMSLVSFQSWGETIDDIVLRDGLIYPKFSETPFSGNISGMAEGQVKNGLKEGLWIFWWENGQLGAKGLFVKSREEGYWIHYLEDGTLNKHLTGTYRHGINVSD